MFRRHQYFVYILTNRTHSVLYTGVTNDLVRRIREHRNGFIPGFTKKYRVNKLVYFEYGDWIDSAIIREKQIKAGSRKKKVLLVESINPNWEDLFVQIDE